MCSFDDMTVSSSKYYYSKHEMWKLEYYVSAENWPGSCAVKILAWREDISFSPPLPPHLFSPLLVCLPQNQEIIH